MGAPWLFRISVRGCSVILRKYWKWVSFRKKICGDICQSFSLELLFLLISSLLFLFLFLTLSLCISLFLSPLFPTQKRTHRILIHSERYFINSSPSGLFHGGYSANVNSFSFSRVWFVLENSDFAGDICGFVF